MSGRRGPISGSHSAKKPGATIRFPAQAGAEAFGATTSKRDPLPTAPPRGLSAAAKRIYLETLPQLVGVASLADLRAFCRWCQLTAEFDRIVTSKSKRRLNEMRAHSRVLAQLEMQLGLTPAGRARLPEPDAADPTHGDEATQASQLA